MSYFECYPGEGRILIGRPQGANARHEYGPQVAQYSGWACAYCGRDLLTSYESWLDLQIDHVVPTCSIKRGFREDWVEAIANCVVCCAACNAFLNRYPINFDKPPLTEEAFFKLRDEVFEDKRRKALKRHAEERIYWEQKKSEWSVRACVGRN